MPWCQMFLRRCCSIFCWASRAVLAKEEDCFQCFEYAPLEHYKRTLSCRWRTESCSKNQIRVGRTCASGQLYIFFVGVLYSQRQSQSRQSLSLSLLASVSLSHTHTLSLVSFCLLGAVAIARAKAKNNERHSGNNSRVPSQRAVVGSGGVPFVAMR